MSLTPVTREIDGTFLANGGITQARAALHNGTLPVIDDRQSLKVGGTHSPPRVVLCAGMSLRRTLPSLV